MPEGIAVLVVDEDEDMLDLTQTFLERESDRLLVTTEKRPAAALESVTDGEFDCVVSDLRMPALDGIELCERIHAERPGLPFFLFTAADSAEIEQRTSDLDLTGVIRKGTGTDHYTELAERIEKAVTRR